MPLGAAPPLTAGEQKVSASETPPVPPAAAAATGAAAGVAAGATTAAAAEPLREEVIHRDRRSWAWVPLLLLLLLAAGTIFWLVQPGSRLFPNDGVVVVEDEDALRVAEDLNASLLERKARLEDALAGAVCRADGTLLLPDGRTPDGLLPPRIGNPADAPGQRSEAAPTPVLPPDPARVVPTTDTASLVDLVESRTVMVLYRGGSGAGNGTGFFVAPDLVVTNFHVIAEADPAQVYVTNEALGRVHSAEIIKARGPLDETGQDFALLRVDGVSQSAFTVLNPTDTLKLQSVVAAGYPNDILASDTEFNALVRGGDATAVPGLTFTDGTINTEQDLTPETHVFVHSAAVARGNSGGPLIDMCGRLVGVNTFVRQGSLRNLNFALSAQDMVEFLEGTDAAPSVVTDACAPQVVRASPPPAADPVDPPADQPAEGGLVLPEPLLPTPAE